MFGESEFYKLGQSMAKVAIKGGYFQVDMVVY